MYEDVTQYYYICININVFKQLSITQVSPTDSGNVSPTDPGMRVTRVGRANPGYKELHKCVPKRLKNLTG